MQIDFHMKLNRTAEPRPRRARAREVLEPTQETSPYGEVLALIEECRPALFRLAELHKDKVTVFTHGREVMDILPELKAHYAPKEKDWRQLGSILSIHSPQDYLAGAVVFFPNHLAEIQQWHTDAIDLMGRSASSGGSVGFSNALVLSWIKPISGWRWKELMDKQCPEALIELKREPNLPAKVVNLARLLLYKADLRPEIQAIVTLLMPAVRVYVHAQLEGHSEHNLPVMLWALKIVFSESVVADEFGRLTFVEGERAAVGKRVELPLRPAV